LIQLQKQRACFACCADGTLLLLLLLLLPQVTEDPDREFPSTTADDPSLAGPRIIEVTLLLLTSMSKLQTSLCYA
jgi:hypothetical protein